jgi:translation initiation factor IF-2
LESVLAKGIRVNQLAKELNVESKAILSKLRDEGLADKAPNHMSVLPLGLAESVREWFALGGGGGGGTAVETAARVEAPVKAKPVRKTTRKRVEGELGAPPEADASEEPHDKPVPIHAPTHITQVLAEAPPHAAVAAPNETEGPASGAERFVEHRKAPEAPTSPAAEHHHAPVMREVAPSEPQTSVTAMPEVETAAPQIDAEAPAHAAAPPVAPPVHHKPAALGPASPVSAPFAGHAPSAHAPPAHAPALPSTGHRPAATSPTAAPANAPAAERVTRPTITLANRSGIAPPPPVERKAITPAPKLTALEAPKMRGPQVIREEKPDQLPAPRPRRPMNEAPATGFTTARPATGRGVKVDDDDDEKKRNAAKKAGASLSGRRRGTDGRRGEAMEKLREFTEADLIARRDALNAAAATRAAVDRHLKQTQGRGTHIQAKTGVQKGEPIQIEEPITVKSLSGALGIKSNDIIKKLMQQGIFANVNQTLDTDSAQAIALEYGIELTIAQTASLEDELNSEFDNRPVAAADLKIRPPVVTILGHVDHGKTSLLDKIRSANVAAGESGGITQHTAAWMVTVGEGEKAKRVTFIDTPGHQAFTSMRARGANMTDVVVLVVSAAEGVQPQTIESINHAKAAGVPIIVAMNKIDRPDANDQKVLGELAGAGLNPVEWGGDTEVVRTSAVTGQGIPELIELLDYQAELLELKADPTAPARGTVIESKMDEGLGPIATVLVQDGTLKLGDTLLSGAGYGRLRSLLDDKGRMIQEATPSMPVIISGLSTLPSAGDKFFVLADVDQARSIAEERALLSRQQTLGGQNKVTLENLFQTMQAGDVQTINLIIKGDVQGSVETLVKTVGGQNTDEVKVRVIHSGVGAINESDVQLAMATMAKPTDNRVSVIGFHVVPDDAARHLAEQNRVEIKLYRVIYEIFDDLKKALSGMLEPEIREKLHGHVEVRQVFKVSRLGNIAGCMCIDGHIQKGSKIRLIRDGKVITEDLTIETLRRGKEDVKEVRNGFECGIKLSGYDDIKVGDKFEAYIRETFQRTL